jgi:hypothetical protein
MIDCCANGWNVALDERRDISERMRRFRFEEKIPNPVTHVIYVDGIIHMQFWSTGKTAVIR